MIFYLLKDGQMSETDKDDFFEQLSRFPEQLVYVIEEESIDIVRQTDIGEYDFSHMVATIESDQEEEDIETLLNDLQKANIREE